MESINTWINAFNLTTALEKSMETDTKTIVTSVSLFLLFLLLILIDSRKVWISIEVLMATMFGLSFAVFPKEILGLQTTGTLTSQEITLARLYGILFQCSGITWYSTRNTRDATVTISLMMSRVCTSSTLLMAQAFTWSFSTSTNSDDGKGGSSIQWGEQFVGMFMFPTGLWLLGNLVFLCRSHDFSLYPQPNVRLNNHLRLDAWLLLLIGATCLTFPEELMDALMGFAGKSEVANHIARSTGALYIGEAIVALQAPGFLHSRDKQSIFLTHVILAVLQLAGLSMSFYFGGVSLVTFACVAVVLTSFFVNSVMGFVADGSVLYAGTPTNTPQSSPQKAQAASHKTE